MKLWKIVFAAGLGLSVMACSAPSNSVGDGAGTDTGDGGTGNNGGNNNGGGDTGGTDNTGGSDEKRLVVIANDEDATINTLLAASDARPGDVIQFECGYYELDTGLVFNTTEDITVEGCGMDETVLSFKNSNTSEGILADNVHGITIRKLTVLDTPGDGIKLKGVNHGTLDSVRTMWSSGGGAKSTTPVDASNYQTAMQVECTDPPTIAPDSSQGSLPGADTTSPDYTPSRETGRYGIYPVASRNILVKNSESIGASDAGIYVGQTTLAIIENSRAVYNVMGLEIENVQGGEYRNNIAECNTGGFLIYDLNNLDQYGYGTRMHGNIARNNNTYNFNSGGFVGNVPAGSGVITLSYDRIDMFDNVIENNDTGGVLWASYEVFPEGAGRPDDKQIDWYTEGFNIYNNTFRNNGNNLAQPNFDAIVSSQGGDIASVLAYLVGIKNALSLAAADPVTLAGLLDPTNLANTLTRPWTLAGFRGSHIVWDGLLDTYDSDCPYPTYTDKDGNTVPVPEATYAPGKPEYRNAYGQPDCLYNGYKFDTEAAGAPRILPEWLGCIADNNTFSADSITFSNFHGTEGLEVVIAADPTALDPSKLQSLMASHDMSAFQCAQYEQEFVPVPPVVFEEYVPSGNIQPAPTEERIAELCNADNGQNVNFAAALEVDCPQLAQYNLFIDPQDPRSTPLSNGVPFSLNTKLFSDNAVKYRVAYMPPGEKADYRSEAENGVNAGIHWPLGTILAKTFAFPNEDTSSEDIVETRLLIKRANPNGSVYWTGMAYIWNGSVAMLAKQGGTEEVSWKFHDADSGALLEGSTAAYSVPHANQCTTCHGNDDVETGAAPIGPKARNINRTYKNESPFANGQAVRGAENGNQIAYLCANNLMTNCPATVAQYEAPSPIYNVPGSGAAAAGTDEDIESRARAYLEVNCQHCHNEKGVASNTGVYFDVFRKVDGNFGICKNPTAAGGEGSGGRPYDIVPGDADSSIVPFRIGHLATTPAARMPPIARSVVHQEAVDLIEQWINDVIVADNEKYGGSESCASSN